MIRYSSLTALVLLSITPLAPAQQVDTTAANRVVLGRLPNGAAVMFVRGSSGDWGTDFTRTFAPYSASVLVLRGK